MSPDWRESAFEAFERAVALARGQSAMARICECTPGNIWQLIKRRSPLPGGFVLKVEAATGISKHQLRPDIYGPEEHPSVHLPAERTVAGRGPVAPCNRPAKLQLGAPVR
jgi:DNA-binding transcriptional regulator YdaS (Cro superfamily)